MKDTAEFYVQPGKYGMHAGGRHPCRSYAAHKTDELTAAWRAALKHWFPSRPNGVILYKEAKAITVEKIGEHEYRATLELSKDDAGEIQLARAITPALELANTEVHIRPAKRTLQSPSRRGDGGSAPGRNPARKSPKKARKK